jgi:ABC-type Fe3+-hydroxamate transport system substrate-binding protein
MERCEIIDFKEIMKKHQNLGVCGMQGLNQRFGKLRDNFKQKLEDDRKELFKEEKQAHKIAQFLAMNVAKIKKTNKDITSYGLKHMVERRLGEYVGNGVFIAAALMAGFEPEFSAGPNVRFNMSKRSLEQLSKAAELMAHLDRRVSQ